MIPFGQAWPASWTIDGTISTLLIAGGASSANSATITNSGASGSEVLDTEIEIDVAYGSTITGGGAIVYICRQFSTGFESPTNDSPYQFAMPVVANTTCHRVETITGRDVGGFQIVIANPATNSTVTATLKSRQSQGQSG